MNTDITTPEAALAAAPRTLKCSSTTCYWRANIEPGFAPVVCSSCGSEVTEVARRAVWVCEINVARLQVAYESGAGYWALGGLGQFTEAALHATEASALNATRAAHQRTIDKLSEQMTVIDTRLAELGQSD